MPKKGSYRRKGSFKRNFVIVGIMIVLAVAAAYGAYYFYGKDVRMNSVYVFKVYVKDGSNSMAGLEGAEVTVKFSNGNSQTEISQGYNGEITFSYADPAVPNAMVGELYAYKEGYVPYVQMGVIPWGAPPNSQTNTVVLNKLPVGDSRMIDGYTRYKNCAGNPYNPQLLAPNIPVFVSYEAEYSGGVDRVYTKMIKTSESPTGYFNLNVPARAYLKVDGIAEKTDVPMRYGISVLDELSLSEPPTPIIVNEESEWVLAGIQNTNVIIIDKEKSLEESYKRLRCRWGDYKVS